MIEAIVQRLQAEAPQLSSVGVAEDLEAIAKGVAPKNGATFVLPFSDRAEPNAYGMGAFSQRVEVQFLVAFVVRQQDDVSGAKRVGNFDALRLAIEGAIAGWAPEAENDLCELAAGRSASLGNGVTVYVQTWRTTRYIRK